MTKISEQTARNFLVYAGFEVNSTNLFELTQYVASNVDFSQFPDADVCTKDGRLLILLADEPAGFQEYMQQA